MSNNRDLAFFSEKDVSFLVSHEMSLAENLYHSQTFPKAILLAGQPGSGKTELSSMLVQKLENDAAFINADDFRRYHPNYKKLNEVYGVDSVLYTSEFSSTITNKLIDLFSQLHINLIIEGTGRTVEVPRVTADSLVAKGYSVELDVLAVRPENSLISILLRFYKMSQRGTIPRATAIETHDEIVNSLPQNLDALCCVPSISCIKIWDREMTLLYDSADNEGTPSAFLESYWARPWEINERESALEAIAQIRKMEASMNLGQTHEIDIIEERINKLK